MRTTLRSRTAWKSGYFVGQHSVTSPMSWESGDEWIHVSSEVDPVPRFPLLAAF